MKTTKKVLAVVLLLALIAVLAVGLLWHARHYVRVGREFYPRDAAELDFRGEALTAEDYEQLQSKLPGTKIWWLVPIQDQRCELSTRALTVKALTEEDISNIGYLSELETVYAEECGDYERLTQLQKRYPGINVRYLVSVDGTTYSVQATKLSLKNITDEELENLQYLPDLEQVAVTGCENKSQLEKLRDLCRSRNISFELSIGGQSWPVSAREMTVSGAGDEVLTLLDLLPELTKLHLVNPTADPAALRQLQQNRTDTQITWEMTIKGRTFPWDAEEVDLSKEEITDLSQVETMMEYLPKAKKLILGRFSTPPEGKADYAMWESPINNQDVADFRERVRDKYKVAWTVQVGRKLTARTDDTTFRPDSHGVGRLFDDEVYNLRYCEDMICIDVGHMTLSDVSWAAYMPHLKYLILAWTQVRDVTPLGNLKELIYLELDYSLVKDVSALVGCTALEDLNLGKTYVDATPLCQMTWLKHLWMIFCPGSSGAYKVAQAVPGCVVVTNGTHTVASGWRNLPNYYAQRDALGMYYMN